MAEHTPGPWTTAGIDSGRGWITTVDPTHGIIATVHRNVGPGDEPAQQEANARLIAKAPAIPELVEALRQLTEVLVAIRDDQVSDDMFGGKSTPERVSNSQQYAAFIRQNASKLDSILPQAEAALALVQDTD